METIQKKIDSLPHTPGIYQYYDTDGVLLYVGKAKNLFRRVHQYFDGSPHDAKTTSLVSQITSIKIISTPSEFDAILLEARLIKQHKPKYNSIAKDDKSPIYLLITTSEPLPRIVVTHKRTLESTINVHKRDHVFGPFSSGFVLTSILRSLRRSIPYCQAKKRNGRPCFYTHLGLCQPCPSIIVKMSHEPDKKILVALYRKNVKRIVQIFSGRYPRVLSELTKEMEICAKAQQFEKAQIIHNQIIQLTQLFQGHLDPMKFTEYESPETGQLHELSDIVQILRPYYPNISLPHRIECIDISNIAGTSATGSLVVAIDGIPDPSEYRRFRIRRPNTPNDVAMIREVVTRRFTHPEWPTPDLLVIDGGKGQLTGAKEALHTAQLSIPVIGLAKRREILVVPTSSGWSDITLPLTSHALHVFVRLRDEAHRFALTYHRLLRKKNIKRNFHKSHLASQGLSLRG